MSDLIEQTTAPVAAQSVLDAVLADPARLAEVDTDKLDRLYAIHRDEQDRRARKEFATAFNVAQGDLTPVLRRGRNDQTRSTYARAEDVKRMLDPILVRCGFSYSISGEVSGRGEDWTKYILTLRHVGGHVETHTMDAPIDHLGPKGNPVKTRLHGMGSSYTYVERHLLCKVFGVQLTDDEDGNAPAHAATITDQQVATLTEWIDSTGTDLRRFLTPWGVGALADMPAANFTPALNMLRTKKLKKPV